MNRDGYLHIDNKDYCNDDIVGETVNMRTQVEEHLVCCRQDKDSKPMVIHAAARCSV